MALATCDFVNSLNLGVPYVQPRQVVTQFVALGDSYTAGTGSNGRPEILGGMAYRGLRAYPIQMQRDLAFWERINGGNRTGPLLTLLAHAGDEIPDMLTKQLRNKGPARSNNWNTARRQPFGNPQMAVMTIGGNDALLFEVLNDCIFGVWQPKDCIESIENTQKFIETGKIEKDIAKAMLKVVHTGREARGADPPESFQLYVPSYISFFNHDNPECGRVDWRFWKFGKKRALRADLRRRFNHLVEQVNDQIRHAAHCLERSGVIYVDGLMEAFNGHRFCEPGQTSQDMTHPDTWFWTARSPIKGTSEGPQVALPVYPRQAPEDETDYDYDQDQQMLLDFIFPDKGYRLSDVGPDTPPPWTWAGAEKYPSYAALVDAIQDEDEKQGDADTEEREQQDPNISFMRMRLPNWLIKHTMPFRYLRSFHPKGSAYTAFKEKIFDSMLKNRDIPKPEAIIIRRATSTSE